MQFFNIKQVNPFHHLSCSCSCNSFEKFST